MQKIQTLLIDDIDGGPADETVKFGLDGTAYEIDLNAKRAAKLRESVAKFVEVARRTSAAPARGKTASRSRATSVDGAERRANVRAWARGPGAAVVKAAGLKAVDERGRIAVAVYQLHDAEAGR